MKVYIPTKGRHDFLKIVVPKWVRFGFEPQIVVDPDEYSSTCSLAIQSKWQNGRVLRLPKEQMGMGAIRQFCLEKCDEEAIYFSDDDCAPMDDPTNLGVVANEQKCLGVGVWFGLYSLYTSLLPNTGIRSHTRSMGQQIWAMNVAILERLGGFDPNLKCYQEDTEVVRQAIKELSICSAIDTGIRGQHLNTKGSEGGLSCFPGRKEQEVKDWTYVFEQWGARYIADPNRSQKFRTMWKKIYGDFSALDYVTTENQPLERADVIL